MSPVVQGLWQLFATAAAAAVSRCRLVFRICNKESRAKHRTQRLPPKLRRKQGTAMYFVSRKERQAFRCVLLLLDSGSAGGGDSRGDGD